MRKIFTFQFLFLITITVVANKVNYDSIPSLAKKTLPRTDELPRGNTPCNFRIRCGRSIVENHVLLVIDGSEIDYEEFPTIDPNSIESINIIKGEMAASIYGNRAIDGAILITTKSSQLRKFIIEDFLDGSRIPRATLSFISIDKRDTITTAANDSGVVITNKLKPNLDYEINISAVGYKDLKMPFKNNYLNKENNVLMERDIKGCNEVVVVSEGGRTISCGFRITYDRSSITKENQIDKSTSISVYPNPVNRGNNFQIQFGQVTARQYSVNVFDMNGREVMRKDLNISSKNQVESINVNSQFSSGTYILRLINAEKKQVYSGKLIVQ